MAATPPNTKYQTLKWAAGVIGCSTDTVRRMISRGELKGYRFGKKSRLIRVREADVYKLARPVTSVGR